MKEVSVFKGFNKVVANQDVQSIVELIKGTKFKEKVVSLRASLPENLEIYSKEKKKLPAFTPSGTFKGGRKQEFLQEYTGIIVLDIDKSDEQTEKYKSIINACPYTFVCFISPGGNGLKVLVRVETEAIQHKESFEKVKSYFETMINFKIDPSGKDITRLCFFSYDPEIYYKEDSWVFKISRSKKDKEEKNRSMYKSQIELTNTKCQFKEGNRNNYVYQLACNCNRAGIPEQHSLELISEDYDLARNEIEAAVHSAYQNNQSEFGKKDGERNTSESNRSTTNKFIITEQYLNERFIIRYNVVSNKFEYKEKDAEYYKELNENNLFVRLQKDNINISLNHLIALLKSDFVTEFNPFKEYFENLPEWNGDTDYIQELTGFLHTVDRKRLEKHFKKWVVRTVKTAIDDSYHNKQALVLVSNKQNSGKSTFCRFLCPKELTNYIVENIGTDKDSMIAITENFLINLDELSTAEKNEINAFKSMFSKDKVKARLTYDKRASVHIRRASFVGSTDRWEFLTDENGSVRWLCFDISYIDWEYSKQLNIDLLYSQAYHLLTKTKFNFELTSDEIAENDRINKKYQVSSPERDLIQQILIPATKDEGMFMTPTEILELISQHTSINLSPERIGKELKFLGFERSYKFQNGNNRYGYFVKEVKQILEQ
jgi:hypothetical protein